MSVSGCVCLCLCLTAFVRAEIEDSPVSSLAPAAPGILFPSLFDYPQMNVLVTPTNPPPRISCQGGDNCGTLVLEGTGCGVDTPLQAALFAS